MSECVCRDFRRQSEPCWGVVRDYDGTVLCEAHVGLYLNGEPYRREPDQARSA